MLTSNVLTATAPSPAVIERRAHERKKYSATCLVHTSQRTLSAMTLDLSEGGACIKLRGLGALAQGEKIAIQFEGCPSINAIARWTKDRRVGLQFTETLDEHAQISVVLARLANEADAEVDTQLH